jgi:protoporphyrinogen oxidase
MWEACADKSVAMGASLLMNTGVKQIVLNNNKWSVATTDGNLHEGFDHVLSSAPMRELIPNIYPSLPQQSLKASAALGYRDFITVVLILPDEKIFDDNWIYIHDPSVKVGRIQNFKSWRPEMIPDPSMACYGLEYFCFEGDGLWTSADNVLIDLGKKEIEKIGLAKATSVVEGYVVRQPKAYPVYDQDYKNNIAIIREDLKAYEGLHLIGRNGMHKYNNQDHSMMTAMLAAKNIIADEEIYDLWNVNEDAEYHEEGERGEAKQAGRMIPNKVMTVTD